MTSTTATTTKLTRRQREALRELTELGRLWPVYRAQWHLYSRFENGDGYSIKTLDALVDAGLARFVHVSGVMPYYVPVTATA